MTSKPLYFVPEQKIYSAKHPDTPEAGFIIGPYRKSDDIWYEVRPDGTEHPLFPSTAIPLGGSPKQVLSIGPDPDNDLIWSDVSALASSYDLPDATGPGIPYVTGAGDPSSVQTYLNMIPADAGKVLGVNTAGTAPVWVALANIPTPALPTDAGKVPIVQPNGTIIWSTTSSVPDAIAKAQILISSGAGTVQNVGSWLNPGNEKQVLSVDNAGNLVWNDVAALASSYDLPDATAGGQLAVFNGVGDPSSTQTYLNIGSAGQVLTVNAAGTLPEWKSSANLPTPVIPADNGKVPIVQPNGSVLWGTVSAVPNPTAKAQLFASSGAGNVNNQGVWINPGRDKQVLSINASGDLVWNDVAALASSYDLPDATAAGQIAYFSGAGDPSSTQRYLNVGTAGQALVVNAGGTQPVWQTLSIPPTPTLPGDAGRFPQVQPDGSVVWKNIDSVPNPTAKSQIFTSNNAGNVNTTGQWLAPGTDKQVLSVNAAGDLVWNDVAALASSYDLPDATARGQIAYFTGGGDPSSTQSYLDIGTVGQALVVNSGATQPVWATLAIPPSPTLPADAGKVPQVQPDGTITWVAVPSGLPNRALPGDANKYLKLDTNGNPVWDTPTDKFGPSADTPNLLKRSTNDQLSVLDPADVRSQFPGIPPNPVTPTDVNKVPTVQPDGTVIYKYTPEFISINEFLVDEEIEVREGLVFYAVPALLVGRTIERVHFRVSSLPAGSSVDVTIQQLNNAFNSNNETSNFNVSSASSGSNHEFTLSPAISFIDGGIIRLNIKSATSTGVLIKGLTATLTLNT